MNNRTATRPAPTVDNARFGAVRADEVRVRDIVEVPNFHGRRTGVVTSTEWVGDDIILSGFHNDGEGSGRWQFTTSEGNGVEVVGRA